MTETRVDDLINVLTSFFTQRGYAVKEPSTLLNPLFEALGTFNPCAGHSYIHDIANLDEELPSPEKFIVIERCVRHVDLEKVGHSNHFSFFEMISNVSATPARRSSKREIIAETYDLLTNVLGIDKRQLLITVFGGGRVKNAKFPPDEETYMLWQEVGISKERLVYVKGHKNFVYLTTLSGEQAGPRCEIYVDRGTQHGEFNRFIEIGTTVFETHRFEKEKGHLVAIPNHIFGNAFGIERLAMILNRKENIYHTDVMAPLIEIINNYLDNSYRRNIFQADVKIIADHVKAVTFIIADGQERDKSSLGEKLKKMLRTLNTEVKLLYIKEEISLYEDLLNGLIEIYKNRYPYLQRAKSKVLNILIETSKKEVFKPDSVHIG
jgi:alanyl-tRNA synthetase